LVLGRYLGCAVRSPPELAGALLPPPLLPPPLSDELGCDEALGVGVLVVGAGVELSRPST
jgi:hypothetical protein